MSKLIGIAVSAIFSLLSVTLAAVNFVRLSYRPDAAGLGEWCAYVGLPVVMLLVFLLVMGVCLFFYWKQAPPSPAPAGPAALKLFTPLESATPEAKRSRIWLIIDELSEALRDDDAGSEALIIVRDRFHKTQFGPSHSTDEPTTEKTAPVKKAG